MNIAVIAANGKTGSLVVKEALAAGHQVTAIARGENRSEAPQFIARDIMDITAEDLQGFDAIVDAFGVFDPEQLPMHTQSVAHLGDVLSGGETPLFVVGGAGSLLVAPDTKLVDTDEFPAEYRELSRAQADQLDYLRTRDDFPWTYVSPAVEYEPDGERTGEFTIVESDELTFDDEGKNRISYADFALGMVSLVATGGLNHRRVNIRY